MKSIIFHPIFTMLRLHKNGPSFKDKHIYVHKKWVMSFHVGPAGRQGLKVILLLACQVTAEEFALSTQYMAINKYYIRPVGASHFEWQSSRSPINLGELWWQGTWGRLMSESSHFLSKDRWPQSWIVYIIKIKGMGLDNRIWAVTLEFANPPPPLFQVQPMLFVMKWMC